MAKHVIESFPGMVEALARMGIDVDNTTRVVIDLQAGYVPVVYVEMLGDEKVIDVVRTLSGIEIERKESSNG